MIKRITIGNSGCKDCIHRATKALKARADVWKVESSIDNGTLDAETTASDEQLMDAVEQEGFFVKKIETLSSEDGPHPSFYIPTVNINQ